MLRILGALGIVWFHMALPGDRIAYAALPVFILLLIRYGAERTSLTSFRRLMVPWLAWSIFYSIAMVAKNRVEGLPPSAGFSPPMLLAGPVIHLWFLPYCWLMLTLWRNFGTPFLIALILALPAALATHDAGLLAQPFAQWAQALPAVVLGLAARTWPERESEILLAGSATAAALALAEMAGGMGQLALAGLLCVLVLNLHLPAPRWLTGVASLTFGLYLAHLAVLGVLHVLGLDLPPLSEFAVSVPATLILVAAIRRVAPVLV